MGLLSRSKTSSAPAAEQTDSVCYCADQGAVPWPGHYYTKLVQQVLTLDGEVQGTWTREVPDPDRPAEWVDNETDPNGGYFREKVS